MEVIIERKPEDAALLAARHIAALIKRKPNAVLGLATGQTSLLLYRQLVRMHQEESLDFSEVTTFNLDEYVGLPPDHPCSFVSYMQRHFFSQVNLRKELMHTPNGVAEDIIKECQEYEAKIAAAGGIDLQILGLGPEGHIGFNEPTSSFASRTRLKTLTERTRLNAKTDFGDSGVPFHVITMGIGTILESRLCILLAYGQEKAEIISRTVEGPLAAIVPASSLQLHANAKVIVDVFAAGRLQRADYYRFVAARKLPWQLI